MAWKPGRCQLKPAVISAFADRGVVTHKGESFI